MSTNRLRWLLIVVVVELFVIIGLGIWALVKPDENTKPQVASHTEEGTFTTSLVATGIAVPTDIVVTPLADDNRLFIVQRAGTIKIIDKNGSQEATAFLDISSKVKDSGEMGLLGMAFHPKFAQNGYFYVNYVDKEEYTNIARFQVNAEGLADPATEKLIFKVKQPYSNHNAGALAFGPDGFLYIPLGDGGSGGDPQNRAQNKAEYLGKLLRVDIDSGDPYSIPTSNPFVANGAFKPEIWAWGLRNPWRISFDLKTGELYIADVGQNAVEEVNIQSAASKGGENYGWPCYEGNQPYKPDGCEDVSKYVIPAFEYTHETGRCSITGGYVYRGSRIPNLNGQYIYGDLCTGEIFATKPQDDSWAQTKLLQTPYMISTFGQDNDGEMYVADMSSGSIYALSINNLTSSNQATLE